MSERVLCIDPGERVGWCTALVEGGDVAVLQHGINSLREFALKLAEVYSTYSTVVYENFRLSAKGAKFLIGNDLQTSQLIGIVRFLGWQHPEVKLVEQTPTHKRTGLKVAPPHIKEIIDAAPKRHDDAHDCDALIHLSYYLHRKGHA